MSFVFEPATDNVKARQSFVVHIGTMLDFRNADQFKQICQEKVRAGARDFILDFSGTNLLDSVGLGAIFSLYRQVTPVNGHVLFAAATGSVASLIQVTKIHKIFRQFPSVQGAQKALATL